MSKLLLPGLRSARWRAAAVVLVLLALLAAAAAWTIFVAPVQAAGRYLAATYVRDHPYRDMRAAVLERDPNSVTVQVTARFANDPDYGAYDDSPTWYQYRTQLALVRRGLSWVPAHGMVLPGERTAGVFTWTATDPVTQRERSQAVPCG